MTESGFRAAVAAGVIGSNDAYRSLLRALAANVKREPSTTGEG